ncbi:MAG: serine/threonine-protein kinase, partial [Planctomycetota bacterium]
MPSSNDDSVADALIARFLETGHPLEEETFVQWVKDSSGTRLEGAELERALGLLRKCADLRDAIGQAPATEAGAERRRPWNIEQPKAIRRIEAGARLGPYLLHSFIARGGMGEVWEAEEVELGRRVALKLVLPGRVDQRALDRFLREAKAGSRMQHPNLVTTLAYGRTDDLSWIAQELVVGAWTLKDFLEDVRRANVLPKGYYRRAADLVRQVALALQMAHDVGVIHRDIKPSNVLITPDDKPKVTDFGV